MVKRKKRTPEQCLMSAKRKYRQYRRNEDENHKLAEGIGRDCIEYCETSSGDARISKTEFSNALGISRNTISQWVDLARAREASGNKNIKPREATKAVRRAKRTCIEASPKTTKAKLSGGPRTKDRQIKPKAPSKSQIKAAVAMEQGFDKTRRRLEEALEKSKSIQNAVSGCEIRKEDFDVLNLMAGILQNTADYIYEQIAEVKAERK